jgi:uncharacterized protein (DUF983 family)
MIDRPETRLTCILRGLQHRCPQCGEGKLFRRYLKPVAQCASCGEALDYIRADDFPPYLTIVVVGHLLIPLVLIAETWGASTAFQIGVWIPLALIMTLALLPRIKGAIIGLMWSLQLSGSEQR